MKIPEDLVGQKVSEAAPALLIQFGATLVGVVDLEGNVVANAPAALELSAGHELIILADSLKGFATQSPGV